MSTQEYVKDRARERWHEQALEAARNSPAFADEVALLEADLMRAKNLQREAMSQGLRERRTLFAAEARAFDQLQAKVDAAEARLDSILHRALPK